MTQNEALLKRLIAGPPITPGEALKELGIMRLSARIHELKQQGRKIKSGLVTVKTRNGKAKVAIYSMGNNR
jgi:hypothetical protein